jgi:hypothetical protein
MHRRSERLIAGSEVFGGVYCVAAGGYLLVALGARSALPIAILLAGGVLSAWAGVALWRRQARGVRLSRLVQALQLVQLCAPGVAFVAVLGPSIVLGVNGSSFQVRAGVEPEVQLAFWSHMIPFRLELNALALVCLFALRRAPESTNERRVASASGAPAV